MKIFQAYLDLPLPPLHEDKLREGDLRKDSLYTDVQMRTSCFALALSSRAMRKLAQDLLEILYQGPCDISYSAKQDGGNGEEQRLILETQDEEG